jgi:hypothetical protein
MEFFHKSRGSSSHNYYGWFLDENPRPKAFWEVKKLYYIPLCHPSILVWPLVVASIFFLGPKFLQNAKNKIKRKYSVAICPFLLKKSQNFWD